MRSRSRSLHRVGGRHVREQVAAPRRALLRQRGDRRRPGPARAALGRGLERLVEEPGRVCRSHSIGSLSPTPRGSKAHEIEPVTQPSGRVDAMRGAEELHRGHAGTAGVEHERADALVAGRAPGCGSPPGRWSARSGAAGSSGTVSVAHWNPPPHACHSSDRRRPARLGRAARAARPREHRSR